MLEPRSHHEHSETFVLSALFAAIIVALGILPPITLGFIPVPITAQSLGVMMAGVVLGASTRHRGGADRAGACRHRPAPCLGAWRAGGCSPTTGFRSVGLAAFTTGYLSERLVKHGQAAGMQLTGFFRP